MRECLDQEVLQSYFDDELSRNNRESVTSHLAFCTRCATAASELESENLLLAAALAPEFDLPVPTERLRRRVAGAVSEIPLVSAPTQKIASVTASQSWFESFTSLFNFTPQRAFVYAGLVVVVAFASIFGIIQWRISQIDNEPEAMAALPDETDVEVTSVETPLPSPDKVIKRAGTPRRQPTPPVKSRGSQSTVANEVKLLPGERSYLKTIASLDDSLRENADSPMRPALQAEFERNLALIDRALAAARTAAKNNPNDPLTAEFMFAAYQSKVDLLNTVADARMYNRR